LNTDLKKKFLLPVPRPKISYESLTIQTCFCQNKSVFFQIYYK
jgi:hypothetical protein